MGAGDGEGLGVVVRVGEGLGVVVRTGTGVTGGCGVTVPPQTEQPCPELPVTMAATGLCASASAASTDPRDMTRAQPPSTAARFHGMSNRRAAAAGR